MSDLPNITEVGAGDWLRMMLYSYPGWGKTSLIGTGPEAGLKTLIIRSSLDLMPSRIMASGAEQVICDNWEAMDQILDYLRMADHGYEWVWWDCISIAQDVLLDDIWEATKIAYPHRDDKTIKGGKDKGEYWNNADRIQMWVRHMVGVNRFHFGITAHPEEGQHPTNDEGGTLLRPFIQVKNMPQKICGYCNLVAFLELMENEEQKWRRFHVAENSRFYAKDLYDAFLPKGYADNMTIPRLVTAIEKARGKPLGKAAPARRATANGRGPRRGQAAPAPAGRRGAR